MRKLSKAWRAAIRDALYAWGEVEAGRIDSSRVENSFACALCQTAGCADDGTVNCPRCVVAKWADDPVLPDGAPCSALAPRDFVNAEYLSVRDRAGVKITALCMLAAVHGVRVSGHRRSK